MSTGIAINLPKPARSPGPKRKLHHLPTPVLQVLLLLVSGRAIFLSGLVAITVNMNLEFFVVAFCFAISYLASLISDISRGMIIRKLCQYYSFETFGNYIQDQSPYNHNTAIPTNMWLIHPYLLHPDSSSQIIMAIGVESLKFGFLFQAYHQPNMRPGHYSTRPVTPAVWTPFFSGFCDECPH